MTIVRGAGDNPGLVEIHKWIELLSFFFGNDIEFEADIFGATLKILEPLFLNPGKTLADTAGLMEAGFFTGFLGQDFVVELNRVIVNLRNRVITDEI